MNYDEGVIKFDLRYRAGPLTQAARSAVPELRAWRHILRQLGIVGQERERYGGAGFGNMSARLPPYPGRRGARAFCITGTQTGHIADLQGAHLSVVRDYDPKSGRVSATGPTKPSSESMTHGTLYDLNPALRYVFHAHAPTLWHRAIALRLPTTRPDVPYGTPEMAAEVARLYRTTDLATLGVFTMAGHEDGVVTFGRTAEEAGHRLVCHLARAMTQAGE